MANHIFAKATKHIYTYRIYIRIVEPAIRSLTIRTRFRAATAIIIKRGDRKRHERES